MTLFTHSTINKSKISFGIFLIYLFILTKQEHNRKCKSNYPLPEKSDETVTAGMHYYYSL